MVQLTTTVIALSTPVLTLLGCWRLMLAAPSDACDIVKRRQSPNRQGSSREVPRPPEQWLQLHTLPSIPIFQRKALCQLQPKLGPQRNRIATEITGSASRPHLTGFRQGYTASGCPWLSRHRDTLTSAEQNRNWGITNTDLQKVIVIGMQLATEPSISPVLRLPCSWICISEG